MDHKVCDVPDCKEVVDNHEHCSEPGCTERKFRKNFLREYEFYLGWKCPSHDHTWESCESEDEYDSDLF
jgi:hypothetical protein